MAITAAISITHESGFHMNPKNLSSLLSCHISLLVEQNKKKNQSLIIYAKKGEIFSIAPAYTFFSSSLLGPKIFRRCSPSADVSPFSSHFNCANTSFTGMLS